MFYHYKDNFMKAIVSTLRHLILVFFCMFPLAPENMKQQTVGTVASPGGMSSLNLSADFPTSSDSLRQASASCE